jgi:hypothetical protein
VPSQSPDQSRPTSCPSRYQVDSQRSTLQPSTHSGHRWVSLDPWMAARTASWSLSARSTLFFCCNLARGTQSSPECYWYARVVRDPHSVVATDNYPHEIIFWGTREPLLNALQWISTHHHLGHRSTQMGNLGNSSPLSHNGAQLKLEYLKWIEAEKW